MFTHKKTKTKKKRIVKPGDAFEQLRLRGGLKLPNPKLMGHREAALHLLMKQIPPIDYSHQVDADKFNLHLLMPLLTLVIHCWKANFGLKLSQHLLTS